MQISPGVSNTYLFAPAPYYKLNKGFFLGFLFKPLGGLQESLGKVSFIYYILRAGPRLPLFQLLMFDLETEKGGENGQTGTQATIEGMWGYDRGDVSLNLNKGSTYCLSLPLIKLVNVYVDLVVFMRIAGTS